MITCQSCGYNLWGSSQINTQEERARIIFDMEQGLTVSEHHTILFQHKARTLSSIQLDQTSNWENGNDNTFLTIRLHSIWETTVYTCCFSYRRPLGKFRSFLVLLVTTLGKYLMKPRQNEEKSVRCNSRLNKQLQKAHYWLRITMFYGIWPLKLHQFSEHYPFHCLNKSWKHYETQAGPYQKDFCMLKVWKTVFADTRIWCILFFHSQEKGRLSIKETAYPESGKCSLKGENSLLEKTHFVLALPESIKIHPYFFPGDANSSGWKQPICKAILRHWARKPCYKLFQHIPLLRKTGATFTKTQDYLKVFLFNEVMRKQQEALV